MTMTSTTPKIEETWKSIPDFPLYKASSLGRIQGPRAILKPQPDKDGYLHVTLRRDGKSYQWLLHRLVCMVFHPETYFDGAYALHKNHVPADCAESNLYWGTQSENIIEMVNAGRGKAPKAHKHYSTKLTWPQVREIRRRALAGEPGSALAKEFGIASMTCNNIINHRSWKEAHHESDR